MSDPNNFLLFGLPGNDSRMVARRLEALFGITMREGSRNTYHGRGKNHDKFSVEHNQDEDEDGSFLHDTRFPQYPVLLEVYDVADQDAYEKAILADPELKAERLVRKVFREGAEGEVITESYGPDGQVTAKVTAPAPAGKRLSTKLG